MGWREKIGGKVSHMKSGTLEQKAQNEQKCFDTGAFATFANIAPKSEKLIEDPLPYAKKTSAQAERATIRLQGRHSFPVVVKMESGILGAVVDVNLWPDRATVDGCQYSNQEMLDLIGLGLSAGGLWEIHSVKKSFSGTVIHAGDLTEMESKMIFAKDYDEGC